MAQSASSELNEVPPILLPFDGDCEASKDADVTLTFDKGDPLHIHSQCLLLASPVLRVALKECQGDGPLSLGSDDRETWVLLLHFIHPLAVARLLKHLADAGLPDLVTTGAVDCLIA